MPYILDTDIVTYQQLGRSYILQELAKLHSQEVATTVVTMYEQLRGRLASINRQQRDEDLQIAFHRLQATHHYYCQILVLPFDALAADHYHRLAKQGIRIGSQDLKIAAIVLAHHGILVTNNRRHFDQIPGLQIGSWL